jgi:uncharacterized protein YuzE
MRFHYDKNKDAFYIRFSDSHYLESDEIQEGVVFDYDKQGKIVGIEVLEASKKLSSTFRNTLLRREIPVSVGQVAA